MKRAFGHACGAALLAVVVTAILVPPAAAEDRDWKLSGEIGGVVDLQGEEFGGGTLFDARIDPDDPLEETAEELRFRDESTRTSGLFELGIAIKQLGFANVRCDILGGVDYWCVSPCGPRSK